MKRRLPAWLGPDRGGDRGAGEAHHGGAEGTVALLVRDYPPRQIGRPLLTRAIAYRLQERAFGGLKPSTTRLLERLVGMRVPASLSIWQLLQRHRRAPS
jgi:hypothetical protein